MANGWGGYREPTNPAPVSGPGALSRRTDGPLRGPVPAPATSSTQGPPAEVSLGPDPSSLTPFGAPTERPDEPITAGAPFGEGPGPSYGAPMSPETAERLKAYLPVLIVLASREGVDPATKQYVRQLRSELG